MANGSYILKVDGVLGFLSGILTLDPITGRVQSLVPAETNITGTVSGRGSSHSNSPVWTFTLTNGSNSFNFTGSGTGLVYNGKVHPRSNTDSPDTDPDDWRAEAVIPPKKKGTKPKAKVTAQYKPITETYI